MGYECGMRSGQAFSAQSVGYVIAGTENAYTYVPHLRHHRMGHKGHKGLVTSSSTKSIDDVDREAASGCSVTFHK